MAAGNSYTARAGSNASSYWPTPAFADEIIHIYLATGLSPGHFNPDEDETIEPSVMPLNRVFRLIRTGRIKDSKTIIAVLAYAQWFGK